MTDGVTGGREGFAELVRWLASWSWPVDEDGSKSLAGGHGWTLIDDDPGKGSTYDTGLADQRSWASFLVSDGALAEVDLTTAFFDLDDPDRERALTDTFVDQVEAVTEVLGAPRVRKPGGKASALWDLPNGAMLDVGRTDRSCSWQFTSPAYAEVQRDLGR